MAVAGEDRMHLKLFLTIKDANGVPVPVDVGFRYRGHLWGINRQERNGRTLRQKYQGCQWTLIIPMHREKFCHQIHRQCRNLIRIRLLCPLVLRTYRDRQDRRQVEGVV